MITIRSRVFKPFVLLTLLAACAGPACPAGGGTPMRVYDLYFGRAVSGRTPVTEAEWTGFRDRVLTPALPDGYTVFDAGGAWMNPRSHTTITEPTKVLAVAMPDTPDSLGIINRLRTAWRRQFHQQSVGMTTHPVCASFESEETAP